MERFKCLICMESHENAEEFYVKARSRGLFSFLHFSKVGEVFGSECYEGLLWEEVKEFEREMYEFGSAGDECLRGDSAAICTTDEEAKMLRLIGFGWIGVREIIDWRELVARNGEP